MAEDSACARPTKRARSASPSASQEPTATPNPASRDAEFYITSGDCTIRVEDTLFKVHQFLLTRDSPVFFAMFTLPQGMVAVEGLSDALPICLSGDRAEDFRSFLKYLYTPAFETQAQKIQINDIHRVIGVAHIAHKYEMPSWQHWAVLVIKELLFRSATALAASDHLAIYQLSNKCSAEILRKKIVEKWLKRIALGDIPISDALDAAEAHNDRDFLTSLYTFQLTQIPATAPTLFQATALGMDGISPLHIQRLLAGYWSLSLSWTQFRQNIPALPRVGTCGPDRHDTICKPAFKSRWDNVVADAEKASITKLDVRIDTMYRHLNHARLSGVAEPLCLPRYSEVVEPLMNIR